MRSLFLRIFLWFWLAMAAVVVVLVVTSPLFTRSRPGLEKWHRDAEARARLWVDRASVSIAEEGPDAETPRHGRGRGHGRGGGRPPSPVFIIDENGDEIRGAEAPPEVFDVARRVLAAGDEVAERSGMHYFVARSVTDPDGQSFAVVAAHQSPPRLVHLLDPEVLSWRLGVLVLVVGALSFWLARYLTSPVAPLRRATRALSDGDLTARVEGKVTGRRDEIGELARDFDAMAERIEGLVGSQQRLLRDVSHELRSPLARLVVALELARSRAGEAAAGSLDRIEREAGRLEELIGRLLLLQRLEVGDSTDDEAELDFANLLGEVVADAGFEAATEGTDVQFESDGDCRIPGRAELLRSAFDNVIRNAIHHTEPGSVVEVGFTTGDGGVTVTVRDRGPGVPEGEIEKIFEPFYRVGEDRDRATGGAGLGLAIANRAVRAHRGRVSAANHPGGGLVVTIQLPT